MKLKNMLEQSRQYDSAEKIRIAVISNITLEPYFPPLLKQAMFPSGFFPEITPIPFEDYTNHQTDLQNAEYILVWLALKALVPNLEGLSQTNSTETVRNLSEIFHNLIAYIRKVTEAPVYWMGFEDFDRKKRYFTGCLLQSQSVADACNAELLKQDMILLDLKQMIAETDISQAYDFKSLYRWNAPYSKLLLDVVAHQFAKQINADRGLSPKCLVLDCDNVLWGGILSEDGVEGVILGASGLGLAYQDFQRFVLSLWKSGIILALCSKNDESDILRMLHTHSGMLIKEENISCVEAGWEDKPAALRRISESLNIGLDSIVFVDDSKFEIEAVKATLSQVKAILFDRFDIYKNLDCFNISPNKANSQSSADRLKTYQDNQKRQQLLEQSSSYDELLKSLELKVSIQTAEPHEYARISELTQRTNRCTNGKRYTLLEVKQLSQKNSYQFLSVYVSDKLGDLGLVGVIGIDESNMDLFCLSCRALGRGVEQQMVEHINICSFDFQSTGKNQVLLKLFKSKFGSMAE